MNICLINKATEICENIVIFDRVQTAIDMLGDQYILTEQTEGYDIGDTYHDGVWSKAEIIPEQKDATQEEDILAMMIDQEYRITTLELGISGEGGKNPHDFHNNKKNDRKRFSRGFGRKA